MCGFTGFTTRSAPPDRDVLRAMGDVIRHRGPDGEGYYTDEHCGLAHRRLSFLDLTNGSQPMSSADGRYVIAYNGEAYNYRELREELIAAGHSFQTNCDTEVILHGYMEWGPEVTRRLRGMFAFVIWDHQKRELYGARDPFGIKPFYYASMGELFFFGSECKSFLPHPGFRKELNPQALKFYLTFQYSALNESFFKNVFRLLPGHQLLWRDGVVELSSYHSFSFAPDSTPLEQRAEEIRRVVTESVEAHQISDVEVGAFLSGGIDSSFITALSRPDKTYSVGFDREGFNETREAQELCKELGLKNVSRIITQEEFFDRAKAPLKEFMLRQTEPSSLDMYCGMAGISKPDTEEEARELPLRIIVPSFATSELKRAFEIGFYLYIPFLLIDIIVASTLMSMGMVMLPPSMISTPFKLLLFITLNGWELVFSSLVQTFR